MERSEEAQKVAATAATTQASAAAKSVPRKIPGKLTHELGRIEQAILDLQGRKHALEAQLSTTQSAPEIGQIGKELQEADILLAAQEERWLAISEEIEQANG